MQERYIIKDPSNEELKTRLKESLLSGEGVSVIASKLGNFTVKLANEQLQFIADQNSLYQNDEQVIILHPESIFTAVAENDFGRGLVSAVHGSAEENKQFVLTIACDEDLFEDIPTELVVEDPDSNSYI